MKKSIKVLVVLLTLTAIFSCKKDEINQNCNTCEGPNVQAFDVCEEDGKIFVDGEEITELEGVSLSRVVRELEANADGDEVFEDLSCR